MKLTEVSVKATVRQGVAKVENRPMLDSLISQLPDGEYVLSLEPAGSKDRSVDQNAYLHAVPFRLMAEHTGYTVTEIKLLLMGECWGWNTVGEHEVPVNPSTSDMTSEECTYFIDWLIPWAAEHFDVLIPLPNEQVTDAKEDS